MDRHFAEAPRTHQLVVVFVDNGCDGGPQVFTGAGHVQPDTLPCGWGPSGTLDQDFGQPSIEGREGLHCSMLVLVNSVEYGELNVGIWWWGQLIFELALSM